MSWEVNYLPEADKDIAALARNQQIIVQKAIKKVKENPLPQSEGGYGKPLGHKHGTNLTNFLKIKLRGEGIRIVYKLIRTQTQMLIVVVGIREDEEVYEIAQRRRDKHNL
jgi:mRNA interferase RelE/StbE